MPVKLQPTSVIKARLGIEPNGRVQRVLTHSCRIHMEWVLLAPGFTDEVTNA